LYLKYRIQIPKVG